MLINDLLTVQAYDLEKLLLILQSLQKFEELQMKSLKRHSNSNLYLSYGKRRQLFGIHLRLGNIYQLNHRVLIFWCKFHYQEIL